jgi:putative colanic acid biosynthesis acetyltransferase WcaF
LGDFVCIGPNVEIYNKASVTIGNNVVISQDSYLCTASHDISSPTMMLITKPIVIGDNVWIGAKANILPGVTIGEGAVVGACAVVAKDVPAWSVVIGNPAKVIKKRNLKEV